MKITDILPDIIGKDLWIAVYRKNRYGGYNDVWFINFMTIRDDNYIIFKGITEGELLTHGRYLDPDSSLFNMESTIAWENIDKCYDVIEPLEIYTFDDVLEMGWEVGEE